MLGNEKTTKNTSNVKRSHVVGRGGVKGMGGKEEGELRGRWGEGDWVGVGGRGGGICLGAEGKNVLR